MIQSLPHHSVGFRFTSELSLLTLKGVGLHYVDSHEYSWKETGKSPLAFINEYRIQKAAQMLSETDLQISQIAQSVGFDNFSYFIRKFREYKSITPKEYRNIWRTQGNENEP